MSNNKKKSLFNSLAKGDDDILPPNMQNNQIPKPPPMQQFQQQMPMPPQMQQNVGVGRAFPLKVKEILQPVMNSNEDMKKEVVSVIVTTCEGSSYDNLFREVAQKVPEGRVAVYNLATAGISDLLDIFKDKKNKRSEEKNVKQLLSEISDLDPDCVLFNWECCSGCDNKKFPNPKTIEFVEVCLEKGFVVMFSDFAVKALINVWEEKRLGKNPFVQIGECQSSIKLCFKNEDLNDCGIPQLEAVGQLCEKGEANLHCLGGTVVVGINKKKATKAQKYALQILTIATEIDGRAPPKNKHLYQEGKFTGTIGHASLKYHKGNGEMIVSAGHWIELSKLDTNVETLEKFASKYGDTYSEDIQYLKSSSVSNQEKKKKMKFMSKMFVQQMPVCKQKKSYF